MLLGLSDKIVKIYGFCNVCGIEATKTFRKTEGGERTQVGAANIYEPKMFKALGAQITIYFFYSSINFSTTDGSASVDVSPKFSKSFDAIFLNILLIIFPDLVFGKPDVI